MTSRVDDVVKRLDPQEVRIRYALRMGTAFKCHVWCEAAVRGKQTRARGWLATIAAMGANALR